MAVALCAPAVHDRRGQRGFTLETTDTMYQRGKIQEESFYYEGKKHDGSLPIIGVNTFLPEGGNEAPKKIELIRATEAEKREQIASVEAFKKARNHLAPSGETGHANAVDSADAPVKQVHDGHGLKYLQDTARARRNVFEALMRAVKTHSLGQISHALYDVRGEYRRNYGITARTYA